MPFRVVYHNIHSALFGFVTKHACDRQTDGQTDGSTEELTDGQSYDSQYRASTAASRSKIHTKYVKLYYLRTLWCKLWRYLLFWYFYQFGPLTLGLFQLLVQKLRQRRQRTNPCRPMYDARWAVSIQSGESMAFFWPPLSTMQPWSARTDVLGLWAHQKVLRMRCDCDLIQLISNCHSSSVSVCCKPACNA